MPRVKFKLLMKYRDLVGKPEVEVEVPEKATVKEALKNLITQYPSLKGIESDNGLVLLRKGKGVNLEDLVEDADEISVLHSVGGG